MRLFLLWFLVWTVNAAGDRDSITDRARRYLIDLIRLDTSNPPGNETRAAQYLQSVAAREGITCELVGPDPSRLNFIARVPGSGAARPLLLMAHTDVVPAEASDWKSSPFSGDMTGGYINGRGALDDKSLLAAELSVLVELKRSGRLGTRDVILLAEADEESGSSGLQWLVQNGWPKIEAEFALNEGGFVLELASSAKRIYHIETAEKVPAPVLLRARGASGHGSLPRPYNPILRVMRAMLKLADADQPVRLNDTTREYLSQMAHLQEYAWLDRLLPELEHAETSMAAANRIREADRELDAQLRTTISPTLMNAGRAVNVIPGVAEIGADVRILPNETRTEVLARLRQIVDDNLVEIVPMPGHNMPATSPSPISTPMYRLMETLFRRTDPNVLVLPYMERGATDGSFLREKGVAVYGLPLFMRGDGRAHGTDERISLASFDSGTEMLWKIVTGISAP